MSEEWKLQVSYKIPGDAMINVRANTSDELSVLLEGIGDYATQIAAVQKLVTGASVAAPLSTPSSTPNIAPPPSFVPPQASVAPVTAAPTTGPTARREIRTRCGSVRFLREPTNASQSTRTRAVSILSN